MIMEKLKVVVVDDSIFILERIINFIAEVENVEIVGMHRSADEAIKSIESLKPDIAVIDIRLNDSSGIDVLRFLKKKHPDIISIMITNYPSDQHKKLCYELGADYFFEKSFEFHKIIDVIKRRLKEKIKP